MTAEKAEENRPPPPPLPPAAESDGGDGGEDFDAILTKLGTGKWNALCYIAIAYWNTVLPYHTIAGAFISPSVDHTCRLPPHALTPTLILPTDAHDTTFNAAHNTTTYNTDVSLPNDASCSYLSENSTSGKVEELPCTEWDFDNSTFTSTVTSEFGLVCEHRYLRAAHQSIYMGGMMVGACFNGFLADRFGRWTMIAISTCSYTVLALGSAWLSTMSLLLVARFLLGTMHPTSLMTGYILVTEITEMKKRSIMAMLSLSTWSVGATLWGLWAYLERDWRLLQTYVSLFCPIFLPALLFLKESPRWLAVRGRHQEALSVLQTAARINGTTLPPTDRLLDIMKEVERQSKSQVESGSNIPLGRRMFDQVTILFRCCKGPHTHTHRKDTQTPYHHDRYLYRLLFRRHGVLRPPPRGHSLWCEPVCVRGDLRPGRASLQHQYHPGGDYRTEEVWHVVFWCVCCIPPHPTTSN